MANKTTIPWTDYTWNPFTGCTPASAGCQNCYAAALAKRFNNGDFTPRFHPERLSEIAKIKKPSMIFVCSVSDLFHEKHAFCDIDNVFKAMRDNPQHVYQILTKRPKYMRGYFHVREYQHPIPDNWWLGVTVENNSTLDRLDILRQIPTRHKFVSFEPLLEDIKNPDLTDINWVIAGGETGTRARPCDPLWISNIWQNCMKKGIPFFFKQWGKHPQQQRIFDTLPEHQDAIARFRQFPEIMMQHIEGASFDTISLTLPIWCARE